jgi:sodium-coupled neutral amino acid transporter 11
MRKYSHDLFSQVTPKTSFDGILVTETGLKRSFLADIEDTSTGEKRDSAASSAVIKQNSPALTIFLLVNTMIGSGILNQPFVFRDAGMVGGVVGFLIASTMTWIGLNLLTAAGSQANIFEYGNLAKHALGRYGEILIDISIIVGSFGALLGYIIVVGSTLSDLLISWGCSTGGCDIYIVTGLSVAIFVAPICLFRHFGHLAWLSLFSVFSIVCVLLLVIIGGPIIADGKGSIDVFSISGMFRSIGSIVFSLSCASANFQGFVSTETKYQNSSAWKQITFFVVLIGSVMLVAMGIAGYASFRGNTDGIILDNFNGHQYDFFKIMIACHLIVYIPVNFVIFRYSLVKLCANTKSEELDWKIHHTISLLLLGFTLFCTLIFYYAGFGSGVAFSLVLNITGGVAGSLTSFILPAAIFLQVCNDDHPLYYWSFIVGILGIALMIVVIIETSIQAQSL